jgi:phosphatidylglycerophosphate synthase
VALRVLPMLLKRPWVTPFRLTAVAAVLGVLSAAAFALGWLVLAAVLYELRFFIDCLDGKVARLRGLSSARGAFFDIGCDVVLIGSNIAALGWYLVVERAVPPALPLAVVVLSLVTFWMILFDSTVERGAVRGGHTSPPPPRRGRVGSFLAERRLAKAPWTIEAETLLLFLAPLTGSAGILHAVIALTCVYYAAASVRLAVRIWTHLPVP